MKKVCQTIKIRKFKTEVYNDFLEENIENYGWWVLFCDNTYKFAYDKQELLELLRKDHIKPIQVIFNNIDKFCIDRNIIINLEELK